MFNRGLLIILLAGSAILNTACAVSGKRVDYNGTQIPPKTNTIIAYSELSQEKMFINAKKILLKRGFSIKSQDKDTFSIKTDNKNGVRSTTFSLKVYIEKTENGSKSTITGYLNLNSQLNLGSGLTRDLGGSNICLIGMDGSPGRHAWNEMYRFAKSISANLEFAIVN